MSLRSVATFLGLLLITSALVRVPALWRDIMCGRLDIAELFRFRFDLMSGAMFFAVGIVAP